MPVKQTTADFVEWVSLNRPDYTVTGEYVNKGTKIAMKHSCGIVSEVRPETFKSFNFNCPCERTEKVGRPKNIVGGTK